METEQVDKRLSWLDEQRRKDVETVNQLNEKLGRIELSLEQQTRQVQDLASEVARLSALAGRINQVDDSLSSHRQEISRQLESFAERREQMDKDQEALRKADRDEISLFQENIKAKLDGLQAFQNEAEARKNEEVRMVRELDEANKKLDEFESKLQDSANSIASMNESQNQDHRRVTDLQSETLDMRTRMEATRDSMDTLDDRARSAETRLSDLSSSENERREAQALWVEQQERRQADFERSWKDWGKRFDEFNAQNQELDEKMLAYEETYRSLRQLHEKTEELIGRLERRISEIAEMQRLSEEKVRQDWSNFQADDQKRWNTYKLTTDEQWREHERLHEKFNLDFASLDENMNLALEAIEELGGASHERIQDLMTMIQEWAAESNNSRTDSSNSK